MRVREFVVMVGTDQPEALARFYGEVLGLPRVERFHDPVFDAGEAKIRILEHSRVHGRNPAPERHQINLFVDDVEAEASRLRGLGVPFVRDPEREWWGGVVATMTDPDGNYVQLLEEGVGRG